MMVLRKLAVALLSAGVMLPGLGHALAVKELQTKSALGEPFRAEVELIELGDLNANEIKVTLASQDDFERMGIDRVFFLSDLRFDVEVNPGGRSIIRITSSKPVVEPYLDFVVRIAWPGNARLQEVTALLDPPLIADSTAAAVDAPVAAAEPAPAPVLPPVMESAPQPAPLVESPAVEAAAPAPVLAEPRPTPAPAPAPQQAPTGSVAPRATAEAAPEGYRVQAGDTAGRLAERFRGGANANQAMIALQRANPTAFARNNINMLKRGQVLRIPSEAQMREVNAQEALSSVREQTARWQASAPKAAAKPTLEAAQVDATAKAPAPAAAPAPVSKPQMKLLGTQTGGKAGTATTGKEQAAAAKPVDEGKLSQVKSLTDAAKSEKDKLSGKVQTLDAKVKANDQKVNIQNARVAQLEAQLRDTQAKAEAAKAEAAKAAMTKTQAAKAELAKAEAAKAEAEAAKAAAEKAEADKVAAAPAAGTAAAPQAEANAAAPAAPAMAPAPAPAEPPTPLMVEEEPVAEEPSMVPMIGGGLAALLAVLGGGWWWNRRRREQAEAEATLAELEGLDADEQGDGGSDFAAAPAASLDDLDDSWLNNGPAAVAAAPAATDRVLADPLEEAEQYIAYERYPQAVGLLTKALQSSPDRADLRMKLLEVYAHLDDWHGFSEQEAWFEQAGDLEGLSRAEDLKAGLTPPAGGAMGQADDSLDFMSAAPAKGHDDLPSLEDLEMDFNANVGASSPALQAVQGDDLGLDFDNFDAAPASATAPAVDAGLDDMSFELDHDAFAEPAPAAADAGLDFAFDKPAASNGGSLGDLVDLDAELSFEPTPAPVAEAPAAEAHDDLSFSLDDLEVSAAPVTAPEVSLDEDFSLDTAAPADDLSFTEMEADDLSLELGADTQAADELADGEFMLDESAGDANLDELAADFDSTMQFEADAPAAAAPVAAAAAPAAGADLGMDDEFDFLADTDENATKLDLARAYIDMGDMEGARDILQEVVTEGSSTQKDEAKGLLAQVG